MWLLQSVTESVMGSTWAVRLFVGPLKRERFVGAAARDAGGVRTDAGGIPVSRRRR